jgi:hypothetical protein
MSADPDTRATNHAQEIIARAKQLDAELKNFVAKYTVSEHDDGFGLITRKLTDGFVVVCDRAGIHEPQWYELNTMEWDGEGEAAERKLRETKGIRWVVKFGVSMIHVYETREPADMFCQKLLHEQNIATSPVKYVDGTRAKL